MSERAYRLRVSAELADLVRKPHPDLKKKLRASLERLLRDPLAGKELRDELEGLRSYKVGGIRIVYRVAKRGRTLELVAIGPRVRIYEETLRMVRRDQDAD